MRAGWVLYYINRRFGLQATLVVSQHSLSLAHPAKQEAIAIRRLIRRLSPTLVSVFELLEDIASRQPGRSVPAIRRLRCFRGVRSAA